MCGGFPGGSVSKESARNAGSLGSIRGLGLAAHSSFLGAFLVAQTLEKGMATHSSILAWRIPWPEELGQYSLHGKELSIGL